MQTESLLRKDLQREFIRRCKKNTSYSLRAFAQFLEVDQSFLSKVLNGKRVLTPKMTSKFSAKLGLSPAKSLVAVKRAQTVPSHFVDLKEDEFETISSWSHFAILELIKIKGFKADVHRVAQQLGLHAEEVKDAIERLARLGFIKVTEKSWVLVSKNHAWTQSEFTTAARTKLQIDLAQKSVGALENIAFSKREHASLTVAIDSRRLPEFKKRISEVILEMSEILQPGQKNLDSVYQLVVGLFPLTQADPKGENK